MDAKRLGYFVRVAKDGSLTKASGVLRIAQPALMPLIVPSHHLGIRGLLNEAAESLSTTLNVRLEADSSRLIKNLVEDGIGYAMLPLSYFRKDFADGKLRYSPITDPTPTLQTVVCVRSNIQDIPGVVSKVRDFIIEAAPDMF
jgi:LysR family transcriptional regulator, nitrogen assimilation regulatory protein